MSLRILAYPFFPIFNTPLKQFLSLFLQVFFAFWPRGTTCQRWLTCMESLFHPRQGYYILFAQLDVDSLITLIFRPQLMNREELRMSSIRLHISQTQSVLQMIHGYQYRACLEMTNPIFISPAARGFPPSTFIIIKILKLFHIDTS